MSTPADCVVLVPVARDIEPETHDGLSRLIARGYAVRTLRGCSQVDFARSIMATRAYDDGFAETLWIDSDVAFDPDDVERLRAHNRPLVCGLYPKKGRPEFACTFREPGTVRFGEGGGLVALKYAGMGFTLVRRQVYEAIEQKLKVPRCGGCYDAKKVVPYFMPTVVRAGGGWEYLSEDAAFCHRAAQLGFPVVADTRIKLGHVGRRVYGWDDFAPPPGYQAIEVTIADTEEKP